MKYLLMVYASTEDWEALSESERAREDAEYEQLLADCTASGEWLAGDPLAGPPARRPAGRSGSATGRRSSPTARTWS